MNALYIACSLITVAYFAYGLFYYVWFGIILTIKEKKYAMALRNVGIIAVLVMALNFLGYFSWVHTAAEIVWAVFS